MCMERSVDIYLANSNLLPAGWEDLASEVAGRYGADYEARFPLSTREEALCAGMLLRLVLGVRTDDDLVIGPFGKPSLAKGYPFFNLTDVDGWTILAVASEEVGVDAETYRKKLGAMEAAAARRVLSPESLAEIERAPESVRPYLFIRKWTRLEAMLKGDGRGFSVDPDYEAATAGWHVATAEAGDICISCALRSGEPALWLRPVSSEQLCDQMRRELAEARARDEGGDPAGVLERNIASDVNTPKFVN